MLTYIAIFWLENAYRHTSRKKDNDMIFNNDKVSNHKYIAGKNINQSNLYIEK